MTPLNPKNIARELTSIDQVQAPVVFQEIMSCPGDDSVARKGAVCFAALHDPTVYSRIVLAGAYGKCVNSIYKAGYTQISNRQTPSMTSSSNGSNIDDIIFCRSAGQTWRDAPEVFRQIYPMTQLSMNSADNHHPIWTAGILCRSLEAISNRPGLMNSFTENDRKEMDEVISAMDHSVEDIASILQATSKQLKHCGEISEQYVKSFLYTLGWIYSKIPEMPDLDFGGLDRLTRHVAYQPTSNQNEAISFLRAKGLMGVAQRQPGHRKSSDLGKPKI